MIHAHFEDVRSDCLRVQVDNTNAENGVERNHSKAPMMAAISRERMMLNVHSGVAVWCDRITTQANTLSDAPSRGEKDRLFAAFGERC